MSRALETMEQLQSLLFDLKVNFRKGIEQEELPVAPMHARLLKLVGHRPGITQQEIVVFTGRDKAQIARLVKELLGKALLKKEQDQHDKRVYRLYLNSAGKDIVNAVLDVQSQVAEQFLSKLSADDVEQFEELLGKIQAGVREVKNSL